MLLSNIGKTICKANSTSRVVNDLSAQNAKLLADSIKELDTFVKKEVPVITQTEKSAISKIAQCVAILKNIK